MTNKVSRREFLKVVGTGAVGLAAGTAIGYKFASKSDETGDIVLREGAPTATPSRGEKITIWVTSANNMKYFPPLVEKFLSDRPNFNHEVEVIHVAGGVYDKFTAALIAGKGAPDTLNVAANIMAGLFKGGMVKETLYDLTPWLLEDVPNYNTEFIKWAPYTDVDGAVYGMEIGLSPCVYYYRKDLHDEAGIDPTTYVTYDDFVEGGVAFNKFHPGKFSMVADLGGTDTLALLMTQNNGGYFDTGGNVIMDSEESIEAFELFYDMAMESKMAFPCLNVWGPGMWAALEDGTAAGQIGADWYSVGVLKAKVPDQAGQWAATKMPVFRPGGAITTLFGGGGHCITKQSEDPDAVWEVLKYCLLDRESQIFKYEVAQYFPNRLDAMNDPRIVDVPDPFYGGQKFGALLAEVAPYAAETPSHPFLPEAMDLLRGVVPIVIAGEKSPRAALEDAAQELKDLMARG